MGRVVAGEHALRVLTGGKSGLHRAARWVTPSPREGRKVPQKTYRHVVSRSCNAVTPSAVGVATW